MSIVSSYTSEAAEQVVHKQRRTATVLSVLISFLVVVLLGLILFLVLIPGWYVETKTIVAYSAPQEEERTISKKEINTQVQRKPSAPSSAMARVIASSSASPVAVPVPDITMPEPSMEFGSGDDFGDGWGSGTGDGSGAGGPGFFGTTSKGNRFCYVIDYSLSMKGKRDKLMRDELRKSLSEIPHGAKYQLIFFAGPAWVAGSKVKNPMVRGDDISVIVGTDDEEYRWRAGKPLGLAQIPEWIEASMGTINKSKSVVRKTPLVLGTRWDGPLKMALSMSPPPQVIYFMTDGSAGKSSAQTARTIGAKAKALGITINCIAMMDPKARDSMGELAKRTGGQFTMVQENGKVKKLPLK